MARARSVVDGKRAKGNWEYDMISGRHRTADNGRSEADDSHADHVAYSRAALVQI